MIGVRAVGGETDLAEWVRLRNEVDPLPTSCFVLPLRGRGIAAALKQALLHWASERDYTELQTWTQDGNAPMQAVNERVGYRPGLVSVTVRGPLLT